MADIMKEQKGKNIPFELTEANRFFLQMLSEIEAIGGEEAWQHENDGQDYEEIFQSFYDMKSPEEKKAIEEYLEREK